MKFITKIKENLWSIPLLGGVIILISLFTPTAIWFVNFNNTVSNWMWGLFYIYFYGNDYTQFDKALLSFIPSIICSVIVGFSAMLIIFCAYNYRKREKDPKNLLIISALAVIISTIVWIIFMEIGWLLYHDQSFWDAYSPSFGLVGIFLGAILTITGYFILKKNRSTN